jgi:hypothetical protein
LLVSEIPTLIASSSVAAQLRSDPSSSSEPRIDWGKQANQRLKLDAPQLAPAVVPISIAIPSTTLSTETAGVMTPSTYSNAAPISPTISRAAL